jgi:hypothetical protein
MGYPELKSALKQRIYAKGDFHASSEDLKAIIKAAPEKDGSISLESARALSSLNAAFGEYTRLTDVFRGNGIDDDVPPGLNGAVKYDRCGELGEFADTIQNIDVIKTKSIYADEFEDFSKLKLKDL